MTTLTHLDAHQSPAVTALPGCWKLEPGRALTLRPRRSGVLRIAHGRVWVTVDATRHQAQAAGDLFLAPGRALVVHAGQRVVLESSDTDRRASAWFSWDPLPQPQAHAAQRSLRLAGRWQLAVAQPVRDLGVALGQAGAALGQAGAALGRLVHGVAGLAAHPLALRWQARRS